jgi:2-desacetyl-2-hydroxyethyl bacteriochlorophyllide A dehydrogenase
MVAFDVAKREQDGHGERGHALDWVESAQIDPAHHQQSRDTDSHGGDDQRGEGARARIGARHARHQLQGYLPSHVGEARIVSRSAKPQNWPMPADARAFWIVEPGRGEIRREPLITPSTDDVVVRAFYSGISRGTEALVFQGRVPPSEFQRMRAPFQDGNFPAPVKYGYASVGRIERGPRELQDRTVFVLYPHQTSYVVPAQAVHVLPDDVPPDRAVLTASLETAINGLWDAEPHIGDRIVIVGGGTVGCLVAWLAGRIPGCDVELVDTNPQREAIAHVFGVRFAQPDTVWEGADVVIHASGSPAGLDAALKIAGFEATVVEMSWYGDQAVPLPLGEAFHARRLTLKSSQVGTVAGSQRARWDTRRRMQLALTMLTDSVLDVLITGESEFDELPDTMVRLASDSGDTLCHRIRYPKE